MITYAGKFYDIAEYNDTFVVHLRLSCKKSHKKCFFLIYITIVRIDENKAYRHGGLYTSGRGQLIIFFYHSNTNTNRVSDNQSYLWKKVFKYTKTLFFNCVLQNTAGHKGLNGYSWILGTLLDNIYLGDLYEIYRPWCKSCGLSSIAINIV